MKVAHISQPSDGGCAVVVRELARAGVAHGDHVTVFSPPGGDLAGWTAQVGAVHRPLAMRRGLDPSDVLTAWRLRALLREFDVVHLHSSKAGFVGRLALATLRGRPRSVFTPHGWSWYVGGRAAVLYRLVERLMAPLVDVIAVVSAGERDDGAAVLGSRARLRIVENGVDRDRFSQRVDRPADAPDGVLVVQVGRLSRQKAQDRSVAAVALLAERAPVTLVLVGDGDAGTRAELAAAATAAGLDGSRVRFTGSTDPRPWLQHADVVVLPSRWEGMSLALLEAMAAGAAVVTTRCAGSDALGEAGIVLDEDPDPAAELGDAALVRSLAGAIDGLVRDDSRRADLGARAARRSERYTFAATFAKYQRLYRRSELDTGPVGEVSPPVAR